MAYFDKWKLLNFPSVFPPSQIDVKRFGRSSDLGPGLAGLFWKYFKYLYVTTLGDYLVKALFNSISLQVILYIYNTN